MDKIKKVIIYTDGACSGNPGDGGWAAVLIYKKHKKEISGYEPDTTNNRMELMAVIKALSLLKEKCEVDLHSDSAYIVDAFNEGWIKNWQSNGWKTKNKDDVLNQDLWKELVELNKKHIINWIKVKGHSDDEINNLCDSLARKAIKEKNKIT